MTTAVASDLGRPCRRSQATGPCNNAASNSEIANGMTTTDRMPINWSSTKMAAPMTSSRQDQAPAIRTPNGSSSSAGGAVSVISWSMVSGDAETECSAGSAAGAGRGLLRRKRSHQFGTVAHHPLRWIPTVSGDDPRRP
ncbi:hypothetical protein [Fodinicola feengrottensis]|uniref:hypothetical protein n=1 Tax=Fodinicola feengrottensis TaxID=435914 RepID=UPI002442535C|nr:hypothetical protein [Fodinicola feengrottensis]